MSIAARMFAPLRLISALCVLLAFSLCPLSVPGCSERAPASAAGPVQVVATTGMVADAVRAVGGDRVQVTQLMGEGVDPHLYKVAPGDIRALNEAGIVFYSGLHLEGKMQDIFENISSTRPVIAVTRGITETDLLHPPDSTSHADPHVWFDVSLWKRTLSVVAEELSKADPAHAAAFATRAQTAEAAYSRLHESVKAAIGTIEPSKRVLVTAHDAFHYYGRAYGIEVLAIQGISTESEASLKDINTLVDTLVTRNVPAVFIESSVPRKTIEALIEGCKARGHTVVIGGELFSDAMGKPGTPEGTYEGMVMHNTTTIVQALSGTEKPK